MQPVIKPKNYTLIKQFAYGGQPEEMKGNKLRSLFKLIQKRGEPIDTDEPKLRGLKALKISATEFVAIKRLSVNAEKFFPCVLKTYILETI